MGMLPSTLGDRVVSARHNRFVGRQPELSRLRDALEAESLPFHVAFVHGPGGIGKTALLDEVARLAESCGVSVARVDARDTDPTPAAVSSVVAGALAEIGERCVLLLDTYERIAALDGWVRRSLVPSLPAATLVVIAGRERPAPEWRSGWAGEVVEIPLRNLSPAEAVTYLASRDVPAEAHDRVLAFTHGHPLALTLVAERVRQEGAAVAFDPTDAPDLLADLLARFASSVPSASHRAALEGAALVRSLTVPLLGALLPPSGDGAPTAGDASDDALFAWLRGLGFAESDARGVRLHDIVRETVEADLRWRDPDRHAALHAQARHYYARRLRVPVSDGDRRQTLADYLHLYRRHPVVEPLLTRLHAAWEEADLSGSGSPRASDIDAIHAAIARHQSRTEADAVAGWLVRQPQAAEIFRRRDGSPAGLVLTLDLSALTSDERTADPVVSTAWKGTRVREGERVLLFRSWLDVEAGQNVSAVQSLVFERTVERYLTTPALAASILLTSEPDLWGPVFSFVGLQRWTSAEVEGGPAAFGKDWRATPPTAWLDALATQAPSAPAEPGPAMDSLVVLSEEAFGEAVREALKAYARPHRLAESPLLASRLVRERVAGAAEPVLVLRDLLTAAAEQLDAGSRERRFYRALDLTYLRPAPTQAVAAERLDLPFSTFRRHLRRGVDHVTDVLWRLETGS